MYDIIRVFQEHRDGMTVFPCNGKRFQQQKKKKLPTF